MKHVTTLHIRNLTGWPLTLEILERLRPLQNGSRTSTTTTTTSAAKSRNNSAALAKAAQNFATYEPWLHVPHLSTVNSGYEAATDEFSSLRLSFGLDRNDGKDSARYRVAFSSSDDATGGLQQLVPLTPSPPYKLAGLYLPDAHTFVVIRHLPPSDWMSSLSSALPLSAVSIPGTHNSHTYHRALPSVRCQAVPIRTQLEYGVRFLDLRVQINGVSSSASLAAATDRSLVMVHGAFGASLKSTRYLKQHIDEVRAFLAAHPSETVLLSLKREGTGSGTDENLAHILYTQFVTPQREEWYTSPRIPYLKDVRGRIVLVRRFTLPTHLQALNDGTGWGVNAAHWPFNTPNHLTSQPCMSASCCEPAHRPYNAALSLEGGAIAVQDTCALMNPSHLPAKISSIKDHLVRAAGSPLYIPGVTTDASHPLPPAALYLNFLTGSNFWDRRCWPERIASIVNPQILEYTCLEHGAADLAVDGDASGKAVAVPTTALGTGVVITDWVGKNGDWDLVRLIMGWNVGILDLEREKVDRERP